MPIQETITIINNSGKIISTGKHLVNIFKDAKAAYKDKKDALRADRAPGVRRAHTFDVVTPRSPGPAVDHLSYRYYQDHVDDRCDGSDRPRSHRDSYSAASSRHSDRPRKSHRRRSSSQSRLALTESNLRTHSEVPEAPALTNYTLPYAEYAPRAMAASHSRPSPRHAATTSAIHPHLQRALIDTHVPDLALRQLVHRPPSDVSLVKKSKIDMNLAYGNIPPDLASRADLDVHDYDEDHFAAPTAYKDGEHEARTLMARIESLLDEAHCLQYSATAIIAHLQSNPEAAAAVALTLAELSTLLGKLSPAFLTVVKGGSPAVFALLASPQFLIAAGVTVGVTVVMFGGWKIIKRIKEAKRERNSAMAFELPHESLVPAAYGGAGSGFDEALVLEEELSTIESWRRGIVPLEDESVVDIELISPEADRRLRGEQGDDIMPDDSASGIGLRTARSSRSHRRSKSAHRSSGRHRSSRKHGDGDDIPERKSSKAFKASEDGESDRNSRHGSHKSPAKRSHKSSVKAIEGGKDSSDTLDTVLSKEKKPNMLKTLFKKKKEKEDQRTTASVVA